MIESEAEVLKVEADQAWVRIRPHTPCGNCDPETGCKSIAMSRMFSRGKSEFQVLNPLHAAPGDKVRVAVADGLLLRSALLGYGLPLCLLLVGAGFGRFLGSAALADLTTLIGAAAGVGVGLLLARSIPVPGPEIVEVCKLDASQITFCKNKTQ